MFSQLNSSSLAPTLSPCSLIAPPDFFRALAGVQYVAAQEFGLLGDPVLQHLFCKYTVEVSFLAINYYSHSWRNELQELEHLRVNETFLTTVCLASSNREVTSISTLGGPSCCHCLPASHSFQGPHLQICCGHSGQCLPEASLASLFHMGLRRP